MERGRPSSAIATSPINREVEKRKQKRTRHRLTCDLLVGTTRHHAIVQDISPAGLFVQTEARPKPNSVVQVIFPARDGRPEITAEAGVARRRAVPPGLQSALPGGVGLELLNPPLDFRELLARELALAAEWEAEAAPVKTFRVRVRRRDGPQYRTLTVQAESVQGARARALARAGSSWKISDVEEA